MIGESTGDYPPRAKLLTVDTPIGGLPLYRRVVQIAEVVWSYARFVGPFFLYKHRMGVMVPLVEKVKHSTRVIPALG